MERNDDSDEDDAAFLKAVKDVKRIRPHNLAEIKSGPLENPIARTGSSHVREDSGDAESGFVRPGIQKMVLRRLRNGQVPMEGELDLHGCTVREAEDKLKAFLVAAQAAGRQRGVRVIHGKGLGSTERKPVLKYRVADWLRKSDAVLAFCTAGPATGGDGAVHILLKRR